MGFGGGGGGGGGGGARQNMQVPPQPRSSHHATVWFSCRMVTGVMYMLRPDLNP